MAPSSSSSNGPLANIRVVELAGLAPGPFAGLLLATYGASVLRIDRPHPQAHTADTPPPTSDLLTTHKTSVALDLKSPGGISLLRAILRDADVLIDPFRPGVLETLGLAPADLLARNKRLVVARLTGFRRDGKYADMAGHDINYLAVSGVLSQLGRKGEPPYPPANILADFAGGGLMCSVGILIALLAREKTGKGQVVESSMVDGVNFLASMMRLGTKLPLWDQPRGENVLDGGAPFYDVYECRCGSFMAVGALEDRFFRELVKGLGIESKWSKERLDRVKWPQLRNILCKKFLSKTRAEWESVFDGKDACCTPVLEQKELEETGYEHRAPLGLSHTSALEVNQEEAWTGMGLSPGVGGEETLDQWLGWRRGRDYEIYRGGLVKKDRAKI